MYISNSEGTKSRKFYLQFIMQNIIYLFNKVPEENNNLLRCNGICKTYRYTETVNIIISNINIVEMRR